jgi:hypothetical protein
MIVLDPGHSYLLDSYDGGLPQQLDFMKREGDGYPGNVGSHSGTNIQDNIRALIHRFRYLNNQHQHINNDHSIRFLQNVLWLLEDRAAERHGFAPHDIDFRPDDIENELYCTTCGHILCHGHEKNI